MGTSKSETRSESNVFTASDAFNRVVNNVANLSDVGNINLAPPVIDDGAFIRSLVPVAAIGAAAIAALAFLRKA